MTNEALMSNIPTEEAPPSGEQYEIGYGHHRVVVTEVGATLRAFTTSGHEVLDGFAVTERCTDGRGQVLAPWPNRLGDGQYSFDGFSANAALDEPENHNAIHGLVRWLPWTLLGRAQNVVTLGLVLHQQPGYPWRLSLTIEYRLGRNGLSVTTEARNSGGHRAPFGLGFHPYLTVGTSSIDSTRLLVPARRRLITDERGLPTGETEVAGSEFDFTAGRLLGQTQLDTGFCDLIREPDDTVRVKLDNADGDRGLTVWADPGFSYFMVYTADKVGDAARRRASIAIEPMTCPPDALRSGTSVIDLPAGREWRGTWGITPRSRG
jgi:aldose 1-epimerase